MYDSLYSHLVSCDLLNPNQSGFRPGDSTINQLISITHTIFQAFDCNPPRDVRSVYLDISKAFDRVWHDGLIHKLKRCGVSEQLLSLIKSFLKDRKQRTVLNGQCSNWGDISGGVPQVVRVPSSRIRIPFSHSVNSAIPPCSRPEFLVELKNRCLQVKFLMTSS